jgi:superfamily I DNA/RNA helicase
MAEVKGVARLIAARIQAGVSPKEIAVLVRSQPHVWAQQLIPELQSRGINAVDIDWVEDVLAEPEIRRGLALVYLALHREDSLAWWTLLKNQHGVASSFVDYVYDATQSTETFGQALLRLHPHFPGAPTQVSARAASELIARTLVMIEKIQIEGAELDPSRLSADAIRLFESVGRAVPKDVRLSYFLGQLEPLGKDLAAKSDAVRIMTMTASKGLTVNTCITMGVEQGLIPHPRAQEDEDRRLLYVAMTRAIEMCVLTYVYQRKGPTAPQGAGKFGAPRRRCPLLENVPVGRWEYGEQVLAQLEGQGK